MVAIVSGNSLGLSLTSFATLGQRGVFGSATSGQSQEGAFVNIANGNLVLQNADEFLAAHGTDISSLRTYNSQGQLIGGQGIWAVGATRQRIEVSGSQLVRTDRDGAQAAYTGDAGNGYISTLGDGAYDRITKVGDEYLWVDGATGLQERYDAAGRIVQSTDSDGQSLVYTYNAGGQLATVNAANGETVTYHYDNGKLTRIDTTLADHSTVSKVTYDYDAADRLIKVRIDLSPADGSIADGNVFETRYTYDGDSNRIASIRQGDGTSLAFTYGQFGGQYKVTAVTDGQLHVTSYQYQSGYTTVVDPVGLATIYRYDAQGQLQSVETGSVAGPVQSMTSNTVTVAVTPILVTVGADPQGRSDLSWAEPQAGTTVLWRYRAQGAADWVAVAVTTADGAQRVVLPADTVGFFEYELLHYAGGDTTPTGRAIGTFTTQEIGQGKFETQAIPVEAVAVQIVAGTQDGQSRMQWAAPAAGTSTVWRYRPAGGTDAQWVTLALQTAAGVQSVDLSGIAAGSYEFDLVETASDLPVAQATGVVVISAPAVAIPTVKPTTVGMNAGGQPQVSWDIPAAGTATTFRYFNGDKWYSLPVTIDAASGKQLASLVGIGSGTYLYRMEQAGTTTALVEGKLQLLPQVAAHTETQDVTVSVLSATNNNGINWPVAPFGGSTTFRYREAGNTYWSTYTGSFSTSSGVQTLNAGSLPLRSRWVEFEILQKSSAGVPTAHATGLYYTTGSGNPTLDLGQVLFTEGGRAVVSGPTTTTYAMQVAVAAYTPAREAGTAVSAALNASGGTQLSWDIPPSKTNTTFRYKDASGSWKSLGTSNDSATGRQFASFSSSMAAGVYEWEMVQTGTVAARVTGTVQIFPPVAAYTETQQVTGGIIPVTSGSTGLSWPAGIDGATTSFRYRTVGSASWNTYNGEFLYSGDLKSIAPHRLPNRNAWVEFEVLLTPPSGGAPTAHATGLYYTNGSGTPSLSLGQVGLQNGSWVILGPTLTTFTAQVSIAGSTPAPLIPPTYVTPLPGITLTTAATRDAAVWVAPPLGAGNVEQAAVSTAQVQVFTYSTNTAIEGLRQVRSFTYNAQGDVVEASNGAGEKVTFEYDSRGNQVLQRDVLGNTVARTYNAAGRLESQTQYLIADPDGAGTALPTGALVTRYVYDPANISRLRFAVSAEGRVTEYRYDGYGQRTVLLAYGAGTYTGVADAGALAAWAAGRSSGISRTDMTYDARGQLDTVTVGGSTTRYFYDPSGRLLKVIDAQLGETSYGYDGMGRLLATINALGQTTLTSYDDAGNRITVTLANGLSTTNTYDRAGRLTSQIQGTGGQSNLGTTGYAWDAHNRLVMTTDPTGQRNFVLYDSQGRRVADIDGDGSLTEYRYDAADRVSRTIQYAQPVNLAQLVDAQGRPLTPTLASVLPAASINDRSTWQAWDAAGRLATSVNGEGAVTRYRYDGASRLIASDHYANALSSTARAALGDAPAVSAIAVAASGDDRVSRSFYDGDGNLVGNLDAAGFLTRNEFDASGRLVHTVRRYNASPAASMPAGTLAQVDPGADGANDKHTWVFYDAAGRVSGNVDANGWLTENSYDANGNLTRQTRYATQARLAPSAITAAKTLGDLRPVSSEFDQIKSWTFDALNRLRTATDAQGTVTRYTYDAAGNVTLTQRALGTAELRTLETGYDVQGRVTSQTSAPGGASTYSYDAAGRRISATDANGLKTRFYYDGDGQLVYTINANGEVTHNVYDGLDQLRQTVRYGTRLFGAALADLAGGPASSVSATVSALANSALDSRVSYSYDLRGAVTQRIDELGNTNTTNYNAFGEVRDTVERIDATSTVATHYDYDKRGLRVQTTEDAAPGGLNRITRATYDAFGRIKDATDGRGLTQSYSYAHDTLGRLVVTTTDALNINARTTYDAFDRVVVQTDGNGNATTTRYDDAARTMTVTTAEDVSVTTTYNRHGQTMAVKDGAGNIDTYGYDLEGNLTSRTSGTLGLLESRHYDAGGRLKDIVDANGVITAYAYDAANRVLTRTVDQGGLNLTTRYTYDARGQSLTVIDADGRVTKNTWDLKGQLLTVAVDPDGLNLKTTYSYDAQGRVLTVTEGADSAAARVRQYKYDKLGRRTEEIIDPAGLKLTSEYAYDGNDNLISRMDGAGNYTRYVYDNGNRLAYVLDGANNLTAYDYDSDGRVTRTAVYAKAVLSTSLAANVATALSMDAFTSALLASVSDPLHDNVTRTVHDKDGRARYVVNANGEVRARTYDANCNVLTEITFARPITIPASLTLESVAAAVALVADASRDALAINAYDAARRLVYQANGAGVVTTYAYDKSGNLIDRHSYATTIADPFSRAVPPADDAHDVHVCMVYDAANRLVKSAQAQGGVSGTPLWGVTGYAYDKSGNLVSRTRYATLLSSSTMPVIGSPADSTTRMVYDAGGRLVYNVDPVGAVTQFAYDAAGRITQTRAFANPVVLPVTLTPVTMAAAAAQAAGSADRVESTTFDAAGRAAFVIDAVGTKTERSYDGAGHVIQSRVYAGADSSTADRVQRVVFDNAGRAIYAIDALGGVVENTYDGIGNLTGRRAYADAIEVASLGAVATFEGVKAALASANSQYATNANNRQLHQEFDGGARLLRSFDSLGNVTQSEYDGLGRLTTLTQPGGRITRYGYDAAGNTISVTDALNHTETWTYDAFGNKLSFTNKLLATWNYEYDAAGRLTTERAPPVEINRIGLAATGVNVSAATVRLQTSIAYDAFGNVARRTEAAGLPEERSTVYEYDVGGRQVKVTFPAVEVYGLPGTRNPTIEVTYDILGNAIANKDVGGNYSYKVYDAVGRVSYEVDAGGYVTGYQRNAFGDVASLTRYAQEAAVTTGTAPSLSQMLAFATIGDHSADRVIKTTYDAAGRVAKVVEPQAYSFDTTHALSGTGSLFTAGRATTSAYNAFGDVLKQSVYAEDANGTRLTIAADTFFSYNVLGQRVAQITIAQRLPSATSASGYLTTMAYDAAGNLTNSVEYSALQLFQESSWNAKTGMAWAIPTKPAGQTEAVYKRETQYQYDLANNKTSEIRKAVVFSTSADGTEATGDTTITYGYDTLGNMVSTTDARGTATYTYRDALGRVTAVATLPAQLKREQLARIYLALLGRAPDADAYTYYANKSALDIVAEIHASPEGQATRAAWGVTDTDNTAFITQLYQGLFARAPDAGGVDYWRGVSTTNDAGRVKLVLDMIAAGLETLSEDSAVMNSRVSAATAGTSLDAATAATRRRVEIAQLYITVMGRTPDPSGLAFYTSGSMTLEAIARAFLKSPEGLTMYPPGATSNTEFATRVFQGIYGRAPSDAEAASWASAVPAERDSDEMGAFIVSRIESLASGPSSNALAAFSNKVMAGLPESLETDAARAPISAFKLDAHGNVVIRTDFAQGVDFASATGYGATPTTADHHSYTWYGTSGHAFQTVDANGKLALSAYDVFGHAVWNSRPVTAADGSTQDAWQIRKYDALGQLVELSESGAAHKVTYNAFGEVISRSTNNDAAFEYSHYDNAGRVWRTNAGDGVDKVYLFDVFGNATSEFRSARHDLKSEFTSASAVVVASHLVRTDITYDLLGNALVETRPLQYASDVGGVNGSVLSATRIVNTQMGELSARITGQTDDVTEYLADMDHVTVVHTYGTTVSVQWGSLAGLGSGDVRVEVTSVDAAGRARVEARDLRADLALTDTTLSWSGDQPTLSISRVRVYKKNIEGNWSPLMDRSSWGDFGTLLRIDAPTDVATAVTLSYRPAGGGWVNVPANQLARFGDALVYDMSSLTEGSYEYKVLYGTSTTPVDTGTITLVSPQLRRQIAQLYAVLLNRASDLSGMGFYIKQHQAGAMSLAQIAQVFYQSPEVNLQTLSAQALVQRIIATGFGVTAVDPNGALATAATTWASRLAATAASGRGAVLADIVSQVANYMGADRDMLSAKAMLANKAAVGVAYAVDDGGGDMTEARAMMARLNAGGTVDEALELGYPAVQRRQLTQLYVGLLNRAPDNNGLGYQLNALATGTSLVQIATNFYNSPEAKAAALFWKADGSALSDSEFVAKLYKVASGRDASAQDIAWWTDRMAFGSSRPEIALQLLGSIYHYDGGDTTMHAARQLFVNKVAIGLTYAWDVKGNDAGAEYGLMAYATGASTAAQAAQAAIDKLKADAAAAAVHEIVGASVTAADAPLLEQLRRQTSQLFVAVLGRAADLDGLTYYSMGLRNGAFTLVDAAQMMYASPEGLTLYQGLTNDQFITKVFTYAFGRAPTSAEMQPWQQKLGTGASKGSVAVAIVDAVMNSADTALAGIQNLFANRTAVSLMYARNMGGGGNLTTARTLMTKVTATETSAAIAYAATAITDAAVAAAQPTVDIAVPASSRATADYNAALTAYNAAAAQDAANATPSTTQSQQFTQIAQLYLGALNRTGGYTELDYYYQEFQQGKTLAMIANQFISSPEGQARYPNTDSNAVFIGKVYTTVLNRAADAGALSYYGSQLSGGQTRGQVLMNIVTGFLNYSGNDVTEHTNRAAFQQKVANELSAARAAAASAGYANLSQLTTASTRAAADLAYYNAAKTAASAANTAAGLPTTSAASQQYIQITMLYLGATNRAGSLSEHNYQYEKLKSGSQSIYQMAQDFVMSAEGQAIYGGLGNSDFVKKIYTVVFGRSYDSAGLTTWTGKLNSGTTRGQVLMDMMTGLLNYSGTDTAEKGLKANFRQRMANSLSAVGSAAQAATNRTTAYNNAVNWATADANATAALEDTASMAAFNASPMAQNLRQITRLYALLLNKTPDIATASSYAAQMKAGMTPAQVAAAILASPEGLALYPSGQSNANFITAIYQNTFKRAPSAIENSTWTSKLAAGKAQAAVDMAAWICGYASTDSSAIEAQNALNGKVMLGLCKLAAAVQADVTAKALSAGEAQRVLSQGIAPPAETLQDDTVAASATGPVQQTGLRPTISRTYDRWGNLESQSDMRDSAWVTRYSFNANNQLTRITDALGNTSQRYYDALGREVAVKDGRGAVNGKIYDALGNLVEELHADGGAVQFVVDVFGNRTRERKANGEVTTYTFDNLGRMTSATKAAGVGVDSYTASGVGWDEARLDVESMVRTELTETYQYDELGRLTRSRDAAGTWTSNYYDLRGNLVTTDAGGRLRGYEWDAYNRKTSETQGDGKAETWAYDAWGRMLAHTNLSAVGQGVARTYAYNTLGLLASEASAGGRSLAYTYDNASGLLVKIEDKSTLAANGEQQVTQYAYDAAGNRTREKTSTVRVANNTQTDVTQDNHIAYDALGRVSDIRDARYSVHYAYDQNGNRIHELTRYRTQVFASPGTDTQTEVESWNAYDVMNRQTIVNGYKDASGAITIGHSQDKAQGQQISYDGAGNRVMVRQWGKQLVMGTEMIPGLSGGMDGQPTYTPLTGWTQQDGYTTQSYFYDAAGRLKDVWQDGVHADARYHDKLGRVIQTGAVGVAGIKTSLLSAAGIATDTRLAEYAADGQMTYQTLKSLSDGRMVHVTNRYDDIGRLKIYYLNVRGSGAYMNGYEYLYRGENASQVQTIVGFRSGSGFFRGDELGRTENGYDANGHLVHVTGPGANSSVNTRHLDNDVHGRVLRKTQGVTQGGVTTTHVINTLIANGEVIGSAGDDQSPDEATFGNSYLPVGDAALMAGPSGYSVQQGDTFQSIAKALWGDANLWYAIADANPMGTLSAGSVITIPTRPNTALNDYQTFKPYSASEAVGDTTPVLPAPKPKKSNWLKQLIMVIIIIVVTVFTAGALAAAGALGGNALGAATLAGVTTGGGLGATFTAGLSVLGGAAGAGAAAAAGALGAAAGSIAGQGFAVASGMQDKLDWRGVGLSAITGGIGAGLGALASTPGSAFAGMNPVARAAITNVASQGIGVVTGLQEHFDWRGVAASAAGAGIGQAVGPVFGDAFGKTAVGQFGARLATGLVVGTAAAVMRGGKVAIQQVATDAFGNALGSSLAEAMGPSDPLGAFMGEQLEAQDRRDRYGLSAGTPSGELGLRLGSANGLRTSASAAYGWSADVDTGISANASRLDMSPSYLDTAKQMLGNQTGDFEGSFDAGDDWSMMQVGGLRQSTSRYKSGSIVELTRNKGRDGAFEGIDDLMGQVGMQGDYRVLGDAMQLGAQLNRMKTELADIRKDLYALGKKPPIDGQDMYAPGEGARVLADKLDEHRNFVRLAVFERSGVLTLNDDMSIRTIGKSQLTMDQFVKETGRQYQNAFSAAVADAAVQFESGKIPAWMEPLKGVMPKEALIGFIADQTSRNSLRSNWLRSEGIPEFAGSIVQMNRNLNDPQGTGNYIRPDVYIDFGPRDRYIFDGSVGFKAPTTPQMRDFARYAYGTNSGGYSRITVIRQNPADSYRPFTLPNRR